MSSEIAIKVENLSKCYQLYDQPHDRLKQSIYPRLQRLAGKQQKQYFREFWALRNISFEIKKGETVGIIGRNGSGKSTLLQMICGTLSPTVGSVQTNGRISALLELGSGFNPEFTGRENVYMNGAVLGLSQHEIEARYDDIVAFADIGEFIEQPVKTYSSGMLVRLAFSVNIMIEPQIMIVDEALSVGDMNFQAKCMTALARIQEKGATILFVSHDISSVKSLCSRGVYLEHGKVMAAGPAAEVAEIYIRTMREEMNEEHRKFSRVSKTISDETGDSPVQLGKSPKIDFKTSDEFAGRVAQFRYGTGEAKVAYVELLNLNDKPITSVEFNQHVKVRIYFEAHTDKSVSVNFYIHDDKNIIITGCGLRQAGQSLLVVKYGEKYLVEYSLKLPLQEGNYSLQVQISSPIILNEKAEYLDVIDNAVVFRVHRWEKARVWSKVHLFPEINLFQL